MEKRFSLWEFILSKTVGLVFYILGFILRQIVILLTVIIIYFFGGLLNTKLKKPRKGVVSKVKRGNITKIKEVF